MTSCSDCASASASSRAWPTNMPTTYTRSSRAATKLPAMTGTEMTEAEELPSPIEHIYPPPGPDGIVVYAWDLDVQTNTGSRRIQGQLELHLFPDSWFGVHFKGSCRD